MKLHGCRQFFFVLLLVGSAASLAAEDCTPHFPFSNGWLGADAAYSIPLADGRSVWIFGDTLIGDKRVVISTEPRMVRNSLGLSTCRNGEWKIDYVIRKDKSGNPHDFFESKSPNWYWALDGFIQEDELWVTLLCLRSTPKLKSEALGFETCGSDLARVTGLKSDPQDWKVEIFPLVADGVKAYPSATTVVEGKYVYLFALYENGTRPMVLTKIPLTGLDSHPAAKMEYLAKDDTWKSGLKPANAKHVMEHGNTEMTVRYHPERKQWLAVMNDPALSAGRIMLRTAPSLTGPWSDGEVIYQVPEMQKGTPGWDQDTFCYAGKEHPEFGNGNSILITYTCNTKKVKKLESNLGIYFPKAVRIALPKAGR